MRLLSYKMAAVNCAVGRWFTESCSIYSRIPNHFISRCSSSSTTADNVDRPLSDNDAVKPFVVNRNPRNLEKMCLGRKPWGFGLDWPIRNYWHKVFLEQSGRHVSAHMRHNTGKTVISASTKEWAIKKHLYSTSDVSAIENVGRVLAQRCLESGIHHVHVFFTQEEEKTNKVKLFKTALEDGGLCLTEPGRVFPVRPWD